MHTLLPHDLLELREDFVPSLQNTPPWLTNACPKWCVVRRGVAVQEGEVPVGFRGFTREQRHAGCIALRHIQRVVRPQELQLAVACTGPHRLQSHLQALKELASLLGGSCWGPSGSVGFELATGNETALPDSDLDIVIRMQDLPAITAAAELHLRLNRMPVRIDAIIESPWGVALADYAGGKPFVLRTPQGPVLCASAAYARQVGE